MQVEGQVGPRVLQDGAIGPWRAGRGGEIITSDAHARFYEATYRAATFSASTPVAGVAPGTALSTTPPYVLYNPVNSGKNLVILRTAVGYVSGTLGAGSLVYASNGAAQPAAPTGGTNPVTTTNLLGSGSGGVGKVYQASTLVAAPLIVRPAFTFGAFLATTAAINMPLIDEVAGEFIVTPGGIFVMQGVAAAGTTPLLLLSCTWEEVPV